MPALPQRLGALVALAVLAAGCSSLERLGQVGREPDFEPIINPTQKTEYAPVSMPIPPPQPVSRQANSLWQTGARAFFKDQRAARIGDILTVEIAINDDATITNETTRTRTDDDSNSVGALLGYEATLNRILPQAVDNTDLINIDTALSHAGTGEITRDDEVNLKIAAVVTQVLPNGNMVIEGSQEVRVNFDLRELQIRGVIRPEDITSANTISYEKIAEARIDYGGRGQIHDVQQPRYGRQILDAIYPF